MDEYSAPGRLKYTEDQVHRLEAVFSQHSFIDGEQAMKLSQELGISLKQTRTWFQNRRAKMRRKAIKAAGRDYVPKLSPCSLAIPTCSRTPSPNSLSSSASASPEHHSDFLHHCHFLGKPDVANRRHTIPFQNLPAGHDHHPKEVSNFAGSSILQQCHSDRPLRYSANDRPDQACNPSFQDVAMNHHPWLNGDRDVPSFTEFSRFHQFHGPEQRVHSAAHSAEAVLRLTERMEVSNLQEPSPVRDFQPSGRHIHSTSLPSFTFSAAEEDLAADTALPIPNQSLQQMAPQQLPFLDDNFRPSETRFSGYYGRTPYIIKDFATDGTLDAKQTDESMVDESAPPGGHPRGHRLPSIASVTSLILELEETCVHEQSPDIFTDCSL